MKLAFVFPGQGAQETNMMSDMVASYPVVRDSVAEISDLTQTDLYSLYKSGDEPTLHDGRLSGLIVAASSAALLELVKQEIGIEGAAFAGYSVGQYTALYAAGAMTLKEMLHVLEQRQIFLDTAAKEKPSRMVGVIGVPQERVDDILSHYNGAIISNYNCPNHFSISCCAEDADKIAQDFDKAEAIKSIVLPVAGGWHSPFVDGAAEELKGVLSDLTIETPQGLFIDNVTAQPVKDIEVIRNNLYDHVKSPVYWQQSVRYMSEQGFEDFVEIGYGDQLSKFIKFTNRRAAVYRTGNVDNFVITQQQLGPQLMETAR